MTNNTLLIRKDGKKIAVADSAAPLKDKGGSVVGSVVVFRDVTKEREIDHAKSEFVLLASHELRTPLSTVSWYVEMLLSGDVGTLKPDQKKYLDNVYSGNQRMIKLVSALLNTSRVELETFTITPKPVYIQKVIDSICDDFKDEIKKKSLHIEKQYDKKIPEIALDSKVIGLAFENVIGNAVKYTPAGGSIRLATKIDASQVLVTVADTGYGIPKDQQDKIFTKLFRGDNVRLKEADGTGLGMYLAKRIVEQFGGKIWFESEENKGSTFYISIPLAGMKERKGGKTLE